LAVLITPSIIAEVFGMDIHIDESERRWQIPRTKTKQIYEFHTEGGIEYGIMRKVECFLSGNKICYSIKKGERI
jgi:hypothetical protein